MPFDVADLYGLYNISREMGWNDSNPLYQTVLLQKTHTAIDESELLQKLFIMKSKNRLMVVKNVQLQSILKEFALQFFISSLDNLRLLLFLPKIPKYLFHLDSSEVGIYRKEMQRSVC